MPGAVNEVLYVMLMTFLLTLIVLYMLIALTRSSRAVVKQPPRIVAVIKCVDGSIKVRDFSEGDFVGRMVKDPCEGEIVASYRE